MTLLAGRFGSSAAQRLMDIYGSAAQRIAELAAGDVELAKPVAEGVALLGAELVHAIESEFALSLEDILARRTMSALDPGRGTGVAGPAAKLLARLSIWDEARSARELEAFRAFTGRHTVGPP